MTNPSPNPAPLRSLTCPNCGAPLEIRTDQPAIRCQYCNANVENPEFRPPEPEPQYIPVYQRPVRIEMEPPPVSQPQRKSSGACAGISVLGAILAVLFVAVGVYLVFSIVPGTKIIGPSLAPIFPLQIESPTLLLTNDGGAPETVSGTYDVAKEQYALTRMNLGTRKPAWSVLGQTDYLHMDALLASDTLVYAVTDTRLIGLNLADGTQAWEATLPDKLPGACNDCITVMKGQIVVLTTDGSLGAYDAQTGHQTWEKRFDNPGSILYKVSDQVGITYNTKKGAALATLDVATGNEVAHIEPACAPKNSLPDEMYTYSQVIFDPPAQPTKAFVFFGTFNACIQRWDLASSKMDWEYAETEGGLSEARETPYMIANGTIFFTLHDQLRRLDAATGKNPQTIEENKDYALLPLLVTDQRLLVRAKRTRGSTQYELWGYDLSNNTKLWKRIMTKSAPMDPPDEKSGIIDKDESGWTYRQTSSGVWLFTFQTVPNQVNLALLNLDTGELGSQKSIPLGIDAGTDSYVVPDRIASSDSLAWYSLDNGIYAIDPESTTFTFKYP